MRCEFGGSLTHFSDSTPHCLTDLVCQRRPEFNESGSLPVCTKKLWGGSNFPLIQADNIYEERKNEPWERPSLEKSLASQTKMAMDAGIGGSGKGLLITRNRYNAAQQMVAKKRAINVLVQPNMWSTDSEMGNLTTGNLPTGERIFGLRERNILSDR